MEYIREKNLLTKITFIITSMNIPNMSNLQCGIVCTCLDFLTGIIDE